MHVFLLLYYYYYHKLRKTVSVTRNIYIPEPGDIIFYTYPTEHKEYTPTRTHSTSGLKFPVLKLTFLT